MPKAAVIHETGTPNVFRWEEVTVGDPSHDEVRLRHTAIGVNYADTYHRRGINHPIFVPEFPAVIGFEAVGVITAIGDSVTEFKVGDKVCYGLPPIGAYSEERLYPAKTLIAVPDGIDDVAIAGILMKGLTAQYLLKRTYPVQPDDVVLVHAAAGGMGHILCPWAKHLGAQVIGTVSSPPNQRSPGNWDAIMSSTIRKKTLQSGSTKSPMAKVAMWFMNPLARTHCKNRSTACDRLACVLPMATHRERRTPSISSPTSANGDHCSSHGLLSTITWRSGAICWQQPTIFSK